MTTDRRYFTVLPSPIGDLLVTGDGNALTEVFMGAGPEHIAGIDAERKDAMFRDAASQLDAYWAGKLTEFDLPLAPSGTPFQLTAWEALKTIPYGETISYAEQARRIGRPTAARAVGHANGRNPIPIIVPCHRVVGTAGALTGYGGGLERKRLLLDLESQLVRS